MAEREGFEPPIALRLCLISSQVHSTGLCHLSVALKVLQMALPQSTGEGEHEAIPLGRPAAECLCRRLFLKKEATSTQRLQTRRLRNRCAAKRAAPGRSEVLLYLWPHLNLESDAKAYNDMGLRLFACKLRGFASGQRV